MPSPESSHAELFGRRPETTLIESLLSDADDAPVAVLFRGDPGVGKTALLDHASRMAREQGRRVVTVHGSEYESDIAYSGLNQAVIALEPYVELLTPEQVDALHVVFGSSALTEVPDRLAVYSAVSALCAAAGRSRPLLICLDDVHWLDRVSAQGFLFAARRLGERRVSLIASARTSPGWLDDVAGLRVHDVNPLDFESAELLLRQRFPTLVPRVRDRLLSDAEGNPLALLELPHALQRSNAAGESLPTNLPLTRRLQGIFADRVKSLPENTRELLLVAALEGTGELNILRRALGDPGLRALDAAEDADIVTLNASGDRLTFRHPLTRSAVAEEATAAQTREAHRKLAEAFDEDLDRRARHLAAAILEPDETVAALLHAAARRAAERGPEGDDAAMELLIRAADLSPSVDDQRRRMSEAAFVGARHGGNEIIVPQVLERVSDPKPGSDEALWAASATAFLGFRRAGDLHALFRLMDSTLDAALAMNNTSSDAYARAMDAYIGMCTVSNDPDRIDRFEAWVRAIPEGKRPPHLAVLSAMLDPARTASILIPIVEEAIARAAGSSDPQVIANASIGATYLDRLSACRPLLARVLELETDSERQGDIPARLQLSADAFQSGRWDELVGLVEDGIALSEHREAPLFGAFFRHYQALLAAMRGDSREVAEVADAMSAAVAGRGYGHVEDAAEHALTLDAIGRGDYPAAFDAASRISKAGELARGVPTALWVFFELVYSAVQLGKTSDARRHVEAIRRLGVAAISPRYALMVAASEAMLLDGSARSAAHLAPFLDDPEVEKWPFDVARMRLLCAEFLIASGKTSDAGEQIARAVVILNALRASPWIRMADRLITQVTGSTTSPNALGLTSTELKVVRLAATGLTNKQIGSQLFLSARTVSSHLYRAFPKLGITRRAALGDAVARLDHEAGTAPSGDRLRDGLVDGDSRQ